MKTSITFCFLMLISATVSADWPFKELKSDRYPLGDHKYLVYSLDTDTGTLKSAQIWHRSVSQETYLNKPAIKIVQNWLSQDGKADRKLVSFNQLDNFLPLFHQRNTSDGVEAFVFDSRRIIGDKTVTGNLKEGFTLSHDSELLNWELDLETFALLDLDGKKEVTLPFYHPGSKTPPSNYTYAVSEQVWKTPYATTLPCWVLSHAIPERSFSASFWIDKISHQVVYVEEIYPSGRRLKVKLP